MPTERLTFKEMCSTFDVTPRTLRYYEYIELLSPEKEGRTRFYTARELGRMKLILRGRKYGFSLEEIRQWLLIYSEEGTQAQSDAFIALADRQLSALTQQQSELASAISDLKQLREDTVKSR
jgi:DNA-binding transcriptional MerR regulator